MQCAEQLFEEPLYLHLLRHPCGMIRSYVDYNMHEAFRIRFKVSQPIPFLAAADRGIGLGDQPSEHPGVAPGHPGVARSIACGSKTWSAGRKRRCGASAASWDWTTRRT